MAFGIDYSDARPSHAAMKAAGVRFVCRYIGSTVRAAGRDSKWLSPAEARSLHADGFDLAVVFETGAQRADGGRAAGLADARTASAELAYCGLPDDLPVYFAVDYDATVGPLITAYFTAVAGVLGLKRVGAYGGYKVIKALFDAHLITYGWQTYAWSGGQWDDRAQLRQYSNYRMVGGVSVDYDRSIYDDFGQWRAAGPTPPPSPDQEDNEMIARDVKEGLGGKSGFPFPAGKFSALLFFTDNGYKNGTTVVATEPVTVRYAILRTDGTWQVGTQKVGKADTDKSTIVHRVPFSDAKNTVAVSVTRVDGDGTEPITFTVA
jgi:hypothetical protein